MGASLYFLYPLLPGGRILSTILAVMIGAILYGTVSASLRSEETAFLLSKLKRNK